MLFQVGIGFLDGTVVFHVGLCTLQWTMQLEATFIVYSEPIEHSDM